MKTTAPFSASVMRVFASGARRRLWQARIGQIGLRITPAANDAIATNVLLHESLPRMVGLGTLIAVQSTSAEPRLTIMGTATPQRIDQLVTVSFVPPGELCLTFADQIFHLPVSRLELRGEIDWQTAQVSSGHEMTVSDTKGDEIPIDAATLRYLVDTDYAAKIDQSIRDLHITPEEARTFSERSLRTVDPRWSDVDDDDLLDE